MSLVCNSYAKTDTIDGVVLSLGSLVKTPKGWTRSVEWDFDGVHFAVAVTNPDFTRLMGHKLEVMVRQNRRDYMMEMISHRRGKNVRV